MSNYIGKPMFYPVGYWQTNNPVLEPKQQCFDTTNGNYKIGDGKSRWNDLPYILVTPKTLSGALEGYKTNEDFNDDVRDYVTAEGLATTLLDFKNGLKPPMVFITTNVEQANLNTSKMVAGTEYFADRSVLVTFPLPNTAAVGDKFFIRGKGMGGWRITQNVGQVVHVGNADTTTGTGTIESQNRYDTIALECIVADTQFIRIAGSGTPTVT